MFGQYFDIGRLTSFNVFILLRKIHGQESQFTKTKQTVLLGVSNLEGEIYMPTAEKGLVLPTSGLVEELTFGLASVEVNKIEATQRTFLAKERK